MSSPRERRAWSVRGPLAAVACAACGAERPRPLGVENGLRVVRCAICGLVYVNPQPGDAELRDFYDGYFPATAGPYWAGTARGMAPFLARAAPRPGRLLDVGAGFGHLLERMKRRGWSVRGVDYSPNAAAHAREAYGIDVFLGSLQERAFDDASFDAVTMIYVLMHPADPGALLAEVRRVLRPGGLLCVTVPNMALRLRFRELARVPGLATLLRAAGVVPHTVEFFGVLDPPAHLFGFDERTLARLLRRRGFEPVRIEPAPPYGSETPAMNALDRALAIAGRRRLSLGLAALAR